MQLLQHCGICAKTPTCLQASFVCRWPGWVSTRYAGMPGSLLSCDDDFLYGAYQNISTQSYPEITANNCQEISQTIFQVESGYRNHLSPRCGHFIWKVTGAAMTVCSFLHELQAVFK